MKNKLFIYIFATVCCLFPLYIIYTLENDCLQLNNTEKELLYYSKLGYTIIMILLIIVYLKHYFINPLINKQNEIS